MNTDAKSKKINYLRHVIEGLQEKAARSEQLFQELSGTSFKLDTQLEIFNRIHHYAQLALGSCSLEQVSGIIAQGVVDIFQLEMGAAYAVDLRDNMLRLKAGCNIPDAMGEIPLPEEWFNKYHLWNSLHKQAIYESPVIDKQLKSLGLAHVIFAPAFNNDQHLAGLVLGGVSCARKDFYTFSPKEINSSFMLYASQMNSILNTATAIARARRNAQAKTSFLAMTANVFKEDVQAAMDAGMNGAYWQAHRAWALVSALHKAFSYS